MSECLECGDVFTDDDLDAGLCPTCVDYEYVTVLVPRDRRPLIEQITNPMCALCGTHTHQIGANND
jgi:Zn finger protein HypA/HybF involved in hydrogenase expression